MNCRRGWGLFLAVPVAVCVAAQARADGQVIERTEPYAISGTSGPELYASIGERGPLVGEGVRTIAHTNFKLTWTRDYQRRGNACTLASARPKLIITYTLPKPSAKLPPAVQKRWEVFIDGIRRHEKVHGEDIKSMVKRIEATTIGFTVDNDPKCTKIREAIKEPLSQASLAQRRQSREFDRVEMGEGGNIRRLILGLLNGE
jgi:predicted secreted Zn-dependent protease